MDNLMVVGSMSSREVAEMTGKNHADIMRDIRDEIEKLENGGESNQSKFALVNYTDSKGEKRPMYQLSMEGVLQLAARYDAITRSKLITMAMKSQQKAPSYLIEDEIERAFAWAEEKKQERLKLKTVELERDYAIATKVQISSGREATIMSKLAHVDHFIKPKEGELSLNEVAITLGCFTDKGKSHTEFIAKIIQEKCKIKSGVENNIYRAGLSTIVDHKTNIVVKQEALEDIRQWILDEDNILVSNTKKGITVHTYKFTKNKFNSKVIIK